MIDIDKLSFNQMMGEEIELIPLVSEEDEKKFSKQAVPEALAILPLKNTVLFPGGTRRPDTGRLRAEQTTTTSVRSRGCTMRRFRSGGGSDPGPPIAPKTRRGGGLGQLQERI